MPIVSDNFRVRGSQRYPLKRTRYDPPPPREIGLSVRSLTVGTFDLDVHGQLQVDAVEHQPVFHLHVGDEVRRDLSGKLKRFQKPNVGRSRGAARNIASCTRADGGNETRTTITRRIKIG